MLTTFYFDDDLFHDDLLDNKLNSNEFLLHECFLEYWESYGCFCYPLESEFSILKGLKKISPKYKQRWQTAISNFSKKIVSLEKMKISEYDDYEELHSDFLSNKIKVGFIASTYKDLFQIENDLNNTEIMPISAICNSEYFINSKKYSSLDIDKNDNINDVWNNRFLTLSQSTKKVTIIDRYLIKNAIADIKNNKNSSLEKFIEFLSKNQTKITVNIFSACDIGKEPTESSDVSYLIDLIKKRPFFNLKNIDMEVSLCKDKLFSTESHDRMIAFDNHVVQIGKGLDIFRENMVVNTTFNIKAKRQTGFDKIYSILAKNREMKLA